MTRVTGWGAIDSIDAEVIRPRTEAEAGAALAGGALIARGMGRAYGDAAMGARVVDMTAMNRMLSFDAATGTLVAEAGVTLAEIIETFLPRGWFPMVTPGTKFVSLGGALAADVHGKNHHLEGSFRACVDWIDVMDAAGTVVRCSADNDPELFHHTIGGMGLTGIILRAQIRLRAVESGFIRQTMTPAPNLDAALAVFERTLDQLYSVAWIDCLASGADRGRALVMTGDHAPLDSLPPPLRVKGLRVPARTGPSVPFTFPQFALNRLTVRAFNALYWWNGNRKAGDSLIDWDSYFYPLDAMRHWNRIYGRKGFWQFQCALPLASHREGLAALLDATAQAGGGSFLAVLKRFGKGCGQVSFPTEGYTLALDFANTPSNIKTLSKLEKITLDHGGRFYLAKDRHLTSDNFHASDPRWRQFQTWRRARGLDTFSSAQSKRLDL